ncbi:MAG: 4-hydroxy-tetrahydrodipicolinate reductase [Candidatus Omnitrophica bacterium]|nr:4-hydroxy-tetrahydrodipicolinate reductase [Candidatus Omnitrophota bacterium]
MNAPLRLVISGCRGRMGSLLVEEALADRTHFALAAGVESPGHPDSGHPIAQGQTASVTSDFRSTLKTADLVIEFTQPEVTIAHANMAAEARVPMLIGTTGFTPAQFDALQGIARQIPVFWSPNMSVGIVIVRRAITAVSKLLFDFGLGEKTRVTLSETHHTRKLDKPSGTAKALRDELLKQTGWLIRDEEIEAKREGDVIGIHSVTFHSPSEKITLTHEATDRRVFAQGALVIARNFRAFFSKPGWYTMDHYVEAIQKGTAR